MSEQEPVPLIPAEMLEAAVDPSLPAGIIGVEDSSGDVWRYPLAEFAVEDDDRGEDGEP